MNENVSLHAEIMRQRQQEEGQMVCFASEPRDECSNIKCRMRHDCFGDYLSLLSENINLNQDSL